MIERRNDLMDKGQAEIRLETKEALRNLLPFLEAYQGDSLLSHVEAAPIGLLRRFYLFEFSSANLA